MLPVPQSGGIDNPIHPEPRLYLGESTSREPASAHWRIWAHVVAQQAPAVAAGSLLQHPTVSVPVPGSGSSASTV